MERPAPSLSMLFLQFGQSGDEVSIEQFINRHHPLPNDVLLRKAAFWSPSQAAFLHQAIRDDADWAEVADEPNAGLRARH